MIRQINYQGSPLYFLADDMGQVWLGGWRSRKIAEHRLEQAEACDWSFEQMDCDVEIEMLDSNGCMSVEADAL